MTCTNGVGKTQICVYWSRRDIKRQKFKYKVKKIIKKTNEPQPFLYSNLAMKDTPFVKVNKDILTRENYRCSVGSVLLLDEYGLVADQNLTPTTKESKLLCEEMRDFWKLCRHELI